MSCHKKNQKTSFLFPCGGCSPLQCRGSSRYWRSAGLPAVGGAMPGEGGQGPTRSHAHWPTAGRGSSRLASSSVSSLLPCSAPAPDPAAPMPSRPGRGGGVAEAAEGGNAGTHSRQDSSSCRSDAAAPPRCPPPPAVAAAASTAGGDDGEQMRGLEGSRPASTPPPPCQAEAGCSGAIPVAGLGHTSPASHSRGCRGGGGLGGSATGG
jgi:hypothetical protein